MIREDPRSLRTRPLASDPASVEQHARELGSHFDEPPAWCSIEAGAEAADVRTLTLTVRDRLNEPWQGRWFVRLCVSTTDGGAPGGTQTLTVTEGTLAQTVIADRLIEVLTDADGTAEVECEVTGSGTRYFTATVLGRLEPRLESGTLGVSWA